MNLNSLMYQQLAAELKVSSNISYFNFVETHILTHTHTHTHTYTEQGSLRVCVCLAAGPHGVNWIMRYNDKSPLLRQ